jgi:hypothetical protein
MILQGSFGFSFAKGPIAHFPYIWSSQPPLKEPAQLELTPVSPTHLPNAYRLLCFFIPGSCVPSPTQIPAILPYPVASDGHVHHHSQWGIRRNLLRTLGSLLLFLIISIHTGPSPLPLPLRESCNCDMTIQKRSQEILWEAVPKPMPEPAHS